MSPSATINVARYSALTAGIFYGIIHRRSLQSQHDKHQYQAEVHKREVWVEEAKKAWKSQQLAKLTGGSVVTDPESPSFDLEAFLNQLATTN
ncbi:hypothetical protein O181_045831 [Austropuccinia psidii MF-1]|uniref:ATP synthase F(0) complex subunit e, mitochondrial n=1 Tax=Austropuccinia psidii MF-1 TaxID=1389203 RepID=A0A9Q3DKW8_9BASI|nr:hypothetical protein [Austropuccinia psidii MF-1]